LVSRRTVQNIKIFHPEKEIHEKPENLRQADRTGIIFNGRNRNPLVQRVENNREARDKMLFNLPEHFHAVAKNRTKGVTPNFSLRWISA